MYRILLILYIIWGGVSIASGQDFNYSFTQLPLIKDYHKLLLPPLQWIRKEDYG